MHLSAKPDPKIDTHFADAGENRCGAGDSNVESVNEGSGRRPGK